MIDFISTFFATFSPVIFTGVFVMVMLKTGFLSKFTLPIDFGYRFIDNKPIFGSSKTWRGLLFYVIFGLLSGFIWFLVCSAFDEVADHNLFLNYNNNSFFYTSFIGMILGLAYAVFELPNSFLKRRIGVNPSESAVKSLPKTIHFIIDQTDSIVGCLVVLWLFYPELGLMQSVYFLIIGASVHIIVNLILYSLKVRKRPV